MDARGNLINNNMNVLLKKLTLINVVFLPLNLLASVGGMSEFSSLTQGIDWRISYSLFMLTMVMLGMGTWSLLVRTLERGNGKSRAVRKRQPQSASSAGSGAPVDLCAARSHYGR